MRERERRIKARIAFRIQELEALPSVLSNRPIEGGALYAIKKEEQQGVDKEGDDDKTTNNTNIATSSLEDKNTSSLKIKVKRFCSYFLAAKNLNFIPSILFTKALIELKALRLIDKQRKLRDSVLKMVAQSTTLSTAVDRSVYRRMKKPVVRDARQTEKIERHQRLEREKR